MRWTSPHSCLTAISQFHSAQRGKIGGLVWTTLLHTRSTTKRKFVLRFKMILHFITTSPLTPAQELLLSAPFGKKIKLYLRRKSFFLTVMYMIRQYCITSHWSVLYWSVLYWVEFNWIVLYCAMQSCLCLNLEGSYLAAEHLFILSSVMTWTTPPDVAWPDRSSLTTWHHLTPHHLTLPHPTLHVLK